MSDLVRALLALAAIPSNLPRDKWHEVGRAAIAAGLSIDDIDQWSSTADNYKSRRDVEAAFRTISPDGGTGPGTLFHIAKQHGYQEAATPQLIQPVPPVKKVIPAFQPKTNAYAIEIWDQCIAATNCEEYIYLKKGKPDGLRVCPARVQLTIRGQSVTGALVVPCWDGETLQTLQFITLEKREKLNLPGSSFGEGFFPVGNIQSSEKIYIVEGIGQAWAITQAEPTSAAVVCFGVGRMLAVAKKLRALYPAAMTGGSK